MRCGECGFDDADREPRDCSKNAPWFTGGDFRRMSEPLHPGWSRIYARVLRPGEISVGDQVSAEPDEAGWVA